MSLSRITGMPVVWQDQHMGHVERAVMDVPRGVLDGLIVRRGFSGARWVGAKQIEMIGERCVILRMRPVRLADKPVLPPMRVFLADGACAGEVTDGIVAGGTLHVCALEVSSGPLAHLMGQSRYARFYRLRGEEIIALSLLSWAQLVGEIGEEDDG